MAGRQTVNPTIIVSTTDGRRVGTLDLQEGRLMGSTRALRRLADMATMRFGSAEEAFRTLVNSRTNSFVFREDTSGVCIGHAHVPATSLRPPKS